MAHELHEQQFLKGTTTVALTFKDGVVVAADKRATMGGFIANKAVEKVHQIGDRTALTIAGGVGDAQALVRLMKAELELYKYGKGQNLSIEGTATLLSNVLQGNKYFPYFVQLIVAGVDSSPKVFVLDIFGGMIPDPYASTGSGSITAYGILDSGFKDNLAEADAVKLAARAIDAAMKRDSFSGEGIDVLVITKNNVKRLTPAEVKPLVAG